LKTLRIAQLLLLASGVHQDQEAVVVVVVI
jgi:hypothetical protein